MSRLSEDALKRGLEAANLRIASLEKQLVDAKKVVVEPEPKIEIEEIEEIQGFVIPKKGKKLEKD